MTTEFPPVDVFISYAPQDEHLLQELLKALSVLQRTRIVRHWHQGRIGPGEVRDASIARSIDSAQVVLLLVSRDYVASDQCYENEMNRAIERHRLGTARVVPIIARECDWKHTPLGALSPLPANGVAIASWSNSDEAWKDVSYGIRISIDHVSMRKLQPAIPGRTPECPDATTSRLASELKFARFRQKKLLSAGASTKEVDIEIVEIRRKLREGGQLRAGEVLGDRYVLISQIGRGGFANVWKAVDESTNEEVAVKVLHPSITGDMVRRERFIRGAGIVLGLDHPAIARVLTPVIEDAGFHYFVMEFLAGGDLSQAVFDGRLNADELVDVALRIGEALAFAHEHERHIIHRDVKPANILLDAESNPKLGDFDLVAARDTTGGTQTGGLGSYHFAAPECLHRPQDADERSDIYSLGMTLAFCLSRSPDRFAYAMHEGRSNMLRRLPVSDAVRGVLKQATRTRRENRIASMREFCAALRSAVNGEISQRDDSDGEQLLSRPPSPELREAIMRLETEQDPDEQNRILRDVQEAARKRMEQRNMRRGRGEPWGSGRR